jgi:hypothetical protein
MKCGGPMKKLLLLLSLFTISNGQSLDLYTDATKALVLGWQGNGTLTEAATGGFEGSLCMKFDYTTQNWWSGVNLVPASGKPLDLRGYATLTIACKISNPGYLSEIDIRPVWATSGTNKALNYKIIPWNTWQSYAIPLDTWSKDSVMNNITGFQIDLIGRGATGTVWFDDIRATGPIAKPVLPAGTPRLVAGQDGATQWGDYVYSNCVWNAVGAFTQNLTAFCDTNQSWRVDWTFVPDTDVQSYPSCAMSAASRPDMVYKLSSRRATFVTWQIDSISSTGSGLDAAFDIFTTAAPSGGASQTELMIWYNVLGNNPLPYMLKKVQVAARGLVIAGQAWDVYYAIYGTNPGWHYIAFVRTPDNVLNIGRYDLNLFFDYAASIGYVNPDHYVTYISAGVELWGGTGMMRTGRFKVDWDPAIITPIRSAKPVFSAVSKASAGPRAIVLMDGNSPSHGSLRLEGMFDVKGRAVAPGNTEKMKPGIFLIK